MAPKVALVSLGCAKNLVDSEVMLGLLEQAEYEVIDEVDQADAIIVNTCAFIQPAVEEAVEALLELADLKQGRCRAIICAGCLPRRYGEGLIEQLPEVDAFIGPDEVGDIAGIVGEALAGRPVLSVREPLYLMTADTPRRISGAEWLACVKIAEGCDHRCGYCLIPALRGRYRSRTAGDIAKEIDRLITEGVREICLIAQDTSAWGRDLRPAGRLSHLLTSLDLSGFHGWLRLQYLHPASITGELIEAVAGIEPLVPYFDIPLQHADRDVLRAMRRPGDAESYLQLIARIRAALPDAALRTTFIVGYPGETPEAFERLLEFVAEARFDRLSAFRYWDEEGTASAQLPDKVPAEVAEERLAELM
ncbi:MAG: 30S ribosomal protein S12 methylthiotransferase RimO, partial [Armatimonadetes bacterium]|nr:30S ribosomal protein S12 methylthiotransferase RimO [Armatimonadota bacterium]